MAYARGKKSQAISDRSGQAFPYREMVKEWTGALAHISEYEAKHPQLDPPYHKADAVALQNARSQDFQKPTSIDNIFASSGGQGMMTANLELPGDFAFLNQGTSAMTPADPSLQNRRRQMNGIIGSVIITGASTANPSVPVTQSGLSLSQGSVTLTANQTLTTTVGTGTLYLGGGATGNVFLFGGTRNIALSAPRNSVITFNQDHSTNDNHPLIITTSTSSPNSYIVSSNIVWYLDGAVTQSNYVNTTNFNAATNRYVQWTPSAAGTYYYACYVHGIGMGGAITIT